MTFPKRVDFTNWLWLRAGIMAAEAVITIHSVYWDDSGREEGKPIHQCADRVEYRLLGNSTENKTTFAIMLYNALSSDDKAKVDRTVTPRIGAIERLYNWLSFAEQEQMQPHYYPYLGRQFRERQIHV